MKKIVFILFLASFSALAETNPPVDDDGVTRDICDVRTDTDDTQNPEEGSLRHRLELFNTGIDENGKCLLGIYFLEPMTIKLKSPLLIKPVETETQGHWVGTYVSGADSDGKTLPVVIDARFVTGIQRECAIVIEGGLSTFQQIHDLTLVVSDETRAVCDEEGNNLLNEKIPPHSSRNCPADTLAQDCDFKDVTLEVKPLPLEILNPEMIKMFPQKWKEEEEEEEEEEIPDENSEGENEKPDFNLWDKVNSNFFPKNLGESQNPSSKPMSCSFKIY